MSAYTTSMRTVSGSYKRVTGRPVLSAVTAAAVVAAMALVVVALVLSARGDSGEQRAAVQSVPAAAQSGLTGNGLTSGYVAHTVYIVGSAEQAVEMEAAMNDLNATRAQLQLPLLQDEVLVASSDADAATLTSGQEELNRVLVGLFTTENPIVDLRHEAWGRPANPEGPGSAHTPMSSTFAGANAWTCICKPR